MHSDSEKNEGWETTFRQAGNAILSAPIIAIVLPDAMETAPAGNKRGYMQQGVKVEWVVMWCVVWYVGTYSVGYQALYMFGNFVVTPVFYFLQGV